MTKNIILFLCILLGSSSAFALEHASYNIARKHLDLALFDHTPLEFKNYLGEFPKTRTLDVSGGNVTGEIIPALAQLKDLTSVSFFDTLIEDADVLELARRITSGEFAKLLHVDLGRCPNIGFYSVQILKDSKPGLVVTSGLE